MPQSEKTLLPTMHARSIRRVAIQRLAVAGLLASATAACSSDTLRFGDNPFSNPFTQASKADATTTGSIGYSPTPPVYAAPLAAPQVTQQVTQPVSQAATRAASGAVDAIGGSAKGWTSQGGSAVYVGSADTLASLSGRYNVPSAAILAANGLTSASQIAPGQRLTIPVYNPGGGALPTTASASASVSQAANHVASQATNTVTAPVRTAAASTVQTASQAVAQPVQRAQAATGSLNEQAAKLSQPVKPVAAPPARQVVASLPTHTDAVKPTPAEQKAASTIAPTPAAPVEARKPEPAKPEPAKVDTAKAEPAKEDAGGFRWPARGRVINGFGNGNEGINIAVPEGTPVKAAEGGVVAYAGSELKGYGNLVLVRHDNGWVSAYANNAELKVKRGDKVTRGQTIARSGQTGNVTSPQLHFELRKGSTPVDPLPHLAGL